MSQLNIRDFDAIAFDFEGTLADTIPTHHKARLAAFEQHGYGHITPEQHALGPTYGSYPADIIGGILQAAGEIEKNESLPFSKHPVVCAIMETKSELFSQAAATGFEAMPGAVEFVKRIAPLVTGRLALVTASQEQYFWPFADRYGLRPYFAAKYVIGHDTIVTEGLQGKPAPDPYILAKKRLDSTRMLAFEDTVSGAASASQAATTVVALGFEAQNAKLFQTGDLAYPPDIFVRNYAKAAEALGLAAA